ncbi:MAG: diaminopimelate decarboxylase [Candidatus Saganbacteria bacterium]|nr:diaminopimelate decarboxylase [Candidatus Saganbacteria bacterium]
MKAVNLPVSAGMNERNNLTVGGCDLAGLAKEFGTPLYIMDERTVRERCREYVKCFRANYPNTEVVFACKALCVTGILEIIASEGLGFDVSSGGELYTALRAKADPKKLYFHGNNKSPGEIRAGLSAGVGRFVVDNIYELKNLDAATRELGLRAEVLVRVNPGIEAHTHEFVQTGKVDSKFGVPLDQLAVLVKEVKKLELVSLKGFHAHIGSQIFDFAPFAAEAKLLLELTQEYGTAEIDLGGGLGIPYLASDQLPPIEEFARQVTAVLKGKTEAKLVLEPGRSIVGQAGVTLYAVGAVREIPGVRKYLIVDGGMSDNPRYVLYGAQYEAYPVSHPDAPRDETVTIAGRFCESGDLIIKDGKLPAVKAGELIAVAATGAYNYSMASNYNRVPRPAMVVVSRGRAELAVKRESYEDLVSNDAI